MLIVQEESDSKAEVNIKNSIHPERDGQSGGKASQKQ